MSVPVRELLHPIRSLADGSSPSIEDSLAAVGVLLDAIAPSDGGGWISMDLDAARTEVSSFRGEAAPDQDVADGVLATSADHPMVRSFTTWGHERETGPRRLSDLATRSELRRTRAYAELLRPLGIEHPVFVATGRSSARAARGWALNRASRDFTDQEMDRLATAYPVLRIVDQVMTAPSMPRAAAMERWGLTAREAEVLGLVATGLTAKAIGAVSGSPS
jgi:hypothetical protein